MEQVIQFFDEQVIVSFLFSLFLWSCIYQESFPNSNSGNIAALFAKNLINDAINLLHRRKSNIL